MCAILDNNVRHEVFGENPTEAGNFFLEWLDRKGQLVVGGKLLQELQGYQRFEMWLRVASRLGRAIRIADETVDTEAESLRNDGICRSNDEHVLALARVSGARLLFTNDGYLQGDFKNPEIIDGVRGRVYTTQLSKDVRRAHRDLLNRNDLCAARGLN
jgi:hypothetical protein